MKTLHLLTFTLLLFATCSTQLLSQTKPTLEVEEYQEWQNLSRSSWLSDDGRWAAYRVSLLNEKDTLYIASSDASKQYKFAYSNNPKFSPNGKWVAFAQGVSPEKEEKMEKKKQRVENKMVLLNLETGKEESIESISSFQVSQDSKHVVMSTYAPKGSKLAGKDLIVRNLETGWSRNIGNVSEFAINDKGNLLAYIIDAEKNRGNGVELYNLEKNQISFLVSDTTTFKKLNWEKDASALTFLQAFKDTAFTEANHRIYAYKDLEKGLDVQVLDPSTHKDFPKAMRIRETYTPFWSKDLERVFIGIDDWEKIEEEAAVAETEEAPKTKKPETEEKVPDMEIWHWKDANIIPRQRKTYNRDKNFTYLSVWNMGNDRFVQIEDEETKDASIVGDGETMVLLNKAPYEPQFRLEHADVYISDAQSGSRKLAMKKFPVNNFYRSSPDGKYLLYFKDNHWYTYEVATEKHRNLTEKIKVPFWNTRYDGPRDILPPFGRGGWLKDDAEVLLYDEYDIWAFKPDGSSYRKLTDGKKSEMVYRVQRTEDEPYIDPAKPLFFNIFGDKTKESGYVQVDLQGAVLDQMVLNKRVRNLVKAEDADVYSYYVESYTDSPDVFVTPGKLSAGRQISNTNPQQEAYAWGKTELIDYKNADGKKLQGLLHYPANYEKGKKYPMITYIYERRTDSKNNYIAPSNRRAYNLTHYVQNDYFVFQPDIIYKTNHPGESAVDCVVPAVEKVLKTGMIDKDKVGIMGHSWGAYQTAFLISQTDIFSAAIAGAPLTNMISMYNSIYWNSGTPDQQIFETSQGRLREPYWNLMDEYIANSPIFQAQSIKTPLLMTFGDQDGAVDYHQGIEMYITMRRLSKPLIMLLYAGENHGLAKKENQIDYFNKVTEFFDHHLKGNEAKEWITKGQSIVQKKENESKVIKP